MGSAGYSFRNQAYAVDPIVAGSLKGYQFYDLIIAVPLQMYGNRLP